VLSEGLVLSESSQLGEP